MRLSDAIRLGAMLKPQGRFHILDEHGRTCALGAALDAVGQLDDSGPSIYALDDKWPWCTAHDDRECPDCRRGPMPSIHTVIVHLNDDHAWTREQIAEWVATVEPDAASVPINTDTQLARCG